MFYKIVNMISVITFKQEKYEQVIQNIENSGGFISYINAGGEKSVINGEYNDYLFDKQEMYTTFYRPDREKESKSDGIVEYISITHDDLSDEKSEDERRRRREEIESLYSKYGRGDDFTVHTEFFQSDFMKTYVHIPILIEKEIFDNTLKIDETLERINMEQLSSKFVLNTNRRFMMLPGLIKNEKGKFGKLFVLATVYNIGIITVQFVIDFEYDRIPKVPNEVPRSMKIPEIHFYKQKESYNKMDFWEKDIHRDMTLDQIMNYYTKHLSLLGKIEIREHTTNRAINWVFGDFELNRKRSLDDLMKENQKFYFSHLVNGNKEYIDRLLRGKIKERIDKALIFQQEDCMFFCDSIFSVITYRHAVFSEIAKRNLEDDEKELKKVNLYDECVVDYCKTGVLFNMFEFTRFYELAFIKKYFIKSLLNDVSSGEYATLKDYNNIRKDLNFLKLRYDEETLFHSEGSAKELYKGILEKTGTTSLLSKAEEMIASIRGDIAQQREERIKQNENTIVIFSSILTIIFGFNGIKLIVNDILFNIPFIGNFISNHPLRFTVGVWGVLIVVMFFFNFKRWKMNKQ